MQVNERQQIYTDGNKVESHLVLQYDGDDIFTLENETNGEIITLLRSELYDVCQIVFARRPTA